MPCYRLPLLTVCSAAALLVLPQRLLAQSSYTAGPEEGSALVIAGLAVIGGIALLRSNLRLRRRLSQETHQRLSAETALLKKRNELKLHADSRNHALHQLSFYDPLTDLPNRSSLYERLTHITHTYQRQDRAFGLILIDLNRFKAINDTLGHYVGDSVLQEVGIRLQKIAGADTIYYLGGDEFAIIQAVETDTPAPETVAMRVHTALSQPFSAKGLPINVTASIGITHYPEHSTDADNLLRYAEIAMYSAKRQQSDYAVYDPSQRKDTKSNLVLASELRKAFDENELLLHYQPKLDFATGEVVGLEALVRWEHPREGLMKPDAFVQLAEQTGLVRPLTLWVLNAVLRQCAAWREQGLELPVAINLSVLNLQDPYLDYQFAELLEAWELPGSTIEIEVTESAAIEDPDRACTLLRKLADLGMSVALDDFGTGYSSMLYLKRLPIDTIKIDKSFVMGMSGDNDDAVIVRTIIDLARNLGLKVVAEGIEDRAHWDQLARLGCDVAQGYYSGRPMDADALCAWLNARERADSPTPEHLLCSSVA